MIATSGSDKPSIIKKKPLEQREEQWVVLNKANKKVYPKNLYLKNAIHNGQRTGDTKRWR